MSPRSQGGLLKTYCLWLVPVWYCILLARVSGGLTPCGIVLNLSIVEYTSSFERGRCGLVEASDLKVAISNPIVLRQSKINR